MRKIFIPILSLGLLAGNAQAQVFSEDFSSGIPSTWTTIDNDGLTLTSGFVSGIVEGWHDWPTSPKDYAQNLSVYDPAGQSDDWLITPEITVTSGATNVMGLSFRASSYDPTKLASMNVLISTTGDEIADFTATLQTGIVPAGWNQYVIDLDAYAGQTVRIAFQDVSNDKFVLRLDDVVVGELQENDAELTSAYPDKTMIGDRTISVVSTNVGSNDITSYDINLTFDGNTTTHSVTGVNMASGAMNTTEISLSVITPMDDASMTVEIVNVNGGTDGNTANNSLTGEYTFLEPVPNFELTDTYGNSWDLHEELAAGKTVVLDFFASWCGPCATSTPALNTFYENNGSGANDVQVFGLTIEQTDNTNSIINNLGWGATYPKFTYSEDSYLSYSHYSFNHELNSGSIPFFVMICPNVNDPGNSTIITSAVGYSNGMFTDEFQPAVSACLLDVEETVINAEVSVFPNPTSTVANINFALNTSADVNMTMVDILGKIVYNTTSTSYEAGNHTISVDVSNLEKGIYLSTLTVNGQAHTVKVTVE